MTNKTGVKANLDGLNKLTKMLKDDKFVRIGIIGSKASRTPEGSKATMAEIGTFHEFGSEKVPNHPPQRSFLSRPLKEKLQFSESEMRDMKKVVWKQFFVKKSQDAFWKELMTRALAVVKEAFETEGYGEWKTLAASTIAGINRKRKLKEGTRKHAKYWFGDFDFKYDDDGILLSYTDIPGRMPLNDTGALKNSVTGKIMKRK